MYKHDQSLTGKFPTHQRREIFDAQQGILYAEQGRAAQLWKLSEPATTMSHFTPSGPRTRSAADRDVVPVKGEGGLRRPGVFSSSIASLSYPRRSRTATAGFTS